MADAKAKAADKPACPVVPPQRRNFLTEGLAVLIGGIVAVFPFAAGLVPFFDPLRRSSGGAKDLRVTSLDAVPDDGVPRPFPIIDDLVDAWTTVPDAQIGSVYLIRQPGSREVLALSMTCPHAGCAVGYSASEHLFRCPCHTSAFDLDGKRRLDLSRVPPRDMDSLVAEVRGNDVWVKFQHYREGSAEKIPKS